MKKFMLATSLILTVCAAQAQIFKWTDSQGNVHFSDHPHEGAEQVILPNTQSFSPPGNPAGTAPQSGSNADQKSQKSENAYTKVKIAQPQDQETIRNNDGYLAVAVEVEPKLAPGDNLQLIFDGSPLGEPQNSLVFQLNGIYRGSHTIKIEVQSASGDLLIASDPITIFMQRARVGQAAKN